MKIEILQDFVNDQSLAEANTLLVAQKIPTYNLALAWSKLAKLALQSGKFMIRAPKIKDVSLIVEIDDRLMEGQGFKILEKCEMIRRTEREASTLGTKEFEKFWNKYPQRVTESGAKTRGNKRNAQKVFSNEIRNQKDFEQLMQSVDNYKLVCSTKPKDAERYIRNSFWKDFIQKPEMVASKTLTTSHDLDRMMNSVP